MPERKAERDYEELRDSCSTAGFTSDRVELEARAAGNEIMSDKKIPTKIKGRVKNKEVKSEARRVKNSNVCL